MKKLSKDELLAKAEETLKRVAGICEDEDLAEAKYLVEALRDEALYEKMGALAEAAAGGTRKTRAIGGSMGNISLILGRRQPRSIC